MKRQPIVARWSANSQSTFFKTFTSWYRWKVARWSVDDTLSKKHRQTDAGYRPLFDWWSPDCRPIINFLSYYLQCIIIMSHNTWNIIMHLYSFWDSYHKTMCTNIIWFFVGFLVELFVWRFEIKVSTLSPLTTATWDWIRWILNILSHIWI